MQARAIEPIGPDASLLIVDEDEAFGADLAAELQARGFDARAVTSIGEGLDIVRAKPPAYAVVDLQVADGTGLDILETVSHVRPSSRVILLSGYGEFLHAVAAVKAGAMDYLTKPSDPDTIAHALRAIRGEMPPPPEVASDPDAVMWDHILRTYTLCDENVTDTAKRLKMHRRTLQRMLKRHDIPRPRCRVSRGK